MHKRNHSLLEGESCRENSGTSKIPKLQNSFLPFLLEETESLPLSIQRVIRDNYNPYLLQSNITGKLYKDGLVFFLMNKHIYIWLYSSFSEIIEKCPQHKEIVVPYPDQVNSLKPKDIVFAGERSDHLFIAVHPNKVFYWCESNNKYVSIELPLRSEQILAIIPDQYLPIVYILTTSMQIFKVDIKESENEYFDEKTWIIEQRIDYSLNFTKLYQNSTFLHSVISSFLPFTSLSFSYQDLAIDYPYIYWIEEKQQVKCFDLRQASVVYSFSLQLPTESTLLTCTSSHSLFLLLIQVNNQSILQVYHLQENTATLKTSYTLPPADYSSTSLFITESYQDLSILLLLPSQTLTLLSLSLSSSQIFTYHLYINDFLFAGPVSNTPGLYLVTSTNLQYFVPEGDSSKKQISPNTFLYLEGVEKEDQLSFNLLPSIIINYQKGYYKQSLYLCSSLFKNDSLYSTYLLQIYQSILPYQPLSYKLNLLLSFLDLFTALRIIHSIQTQQTSIEQEINQTLKQIMLSLLQPQQSLIHQASTIEKQIAVLLDYWQDFNHHFPSSFKCNILLWKEDQSIQESFLQFISSLSLLPHLSYDLPHIESCLYKIIQLYTSPSLHISHIIVDKCIELLEVSPSSSFLSFLQQQQYYSYLIKQPSSSLLSFIQQDSSFAQFAIEYFLQHPSSLLISILQAWPQFLPDVSKKNSWILFQYALATGEPIKQIHNREDLAQFIWSLQSRQEQIEVLSYLYLQLVSETKENCLFPSHLISLDWIMNLRECVEAEVALAHSFNQSINIDINTLWEIAIQHIHSRNDDLQILDNLILILNCYNQLGETKLNMLDLLLYQVLVVDQSLVNCTEINWDQSALVYVLSKLRNRQWKQWKDEFISNHSISNESLKFLDKCWSFVQ